MEEKDACKIHSYHVITDNLYLGYDIRLLLEDMAGEKEERYASLPDSRITLEEWMSPQMHYCRASFQRLVRSSPLP